MGSCSFGLNKVFFLKCENEQGQEGRPNPNTECLEKPNLPRVILIKNFIFSKENLELENI